MEKRPFQNHPAAGRSKAVECRRGYRSVWEVEVGGQMSEAKIRNIALLLATLVVGCGAPKADFRRYTTYAHKSAENAGLANGFSRDQLQGVDETMQALFGTPDEPLLPAVEGIELPKIVNFSHLKIAAGPVGSDEQGNPRGLYREHCAHCHGISGDGVGPTAAFLNP